MPISFQLQFGRLGSVEVGSHPWGNPFMIPGAPAPVRLEELILSNSDEDIILDPVFVEEQDAVSSLLSEVWPVDLHDRLRQLVNNSLGEFPIQQLGVIFAPIYAPRPEVFGVMFDTGFLDDDQAGIDLTHLGLPREGCAIFVDRIRSARQGGVGNAPYDSAADAQIAFTVAHELGHVFNLMHTQGRDCFLETSPGGVNAPPLHWYRFLDHQQEWLGLCSGSDRVQPGRLGFDSIYYADRGPIRQRRSHPYNDRLKLSIGMRPRSFFAWEPVELDITLKHLGEKGDTAISVPDELDPGYPTFAIWLEQPDGERRRYRATKHYCPSGAVKKLRPGESFHRDMSIFGQSGGYTFGMPGEYRICVEWRIHRRLTLRSNEVTVEVRDEKLREKGARERHQQIRQQTRAAARVLYYRTGAQRDRTLAALRDLADRRHPDHIKSAAEYALGRWLRHQGERNPARAADWFRQARLYLERAAERKALSPHRRRLARQISK